MGLFGHKGGLSKLEHGIKHTVKKTGSVVHDVWTHGGREALLTAGLVAAAIYTGGAAAGLISGVETAGAAAGTTAAATAGGAAAMTGTAITGSLLAGGYMGYNAAETHHEESELRKQQAKQQAITDAENAKADAQRRANLLSLRKQVGAVNIGSKSTVFTGSSADSKQKVNEIVLG